MTNKTVEENKNLTLRDGVNSFRDIGLDFNRVKDEWLKEGSNNYLLFYKVGDKNIPIIKNRSGNGSLNVDVIVCSDYEIYDYEGYIDIDNIKDVVKNRILEISVEEKFAKKLVELGVAIYLSDLNKYEESIYIKDNECGDNPIGVKYSCYIDLTDLFK